MFMLLLPGWWKTKGTQKKQHNKKGNSSFWGTKRTNPKKSNKQTKQRQKQKREEDGPRGPGEEAHPDRSAPRGEFSFVGPNRNGIDLLPGWSAPRSWPPESATTGRPTPRARPSGRFLHHPKAEGPTKKKHKKTDVPRGKAKKKIGAGSGG